MQAERIRFAPRRRFALVLCARKRTHKRKFISVGQQPCRILRRPDECRLRRGGSEKTML